MISQAMDWVGQTNVELVKKMTSVTQKIFRVGKITLVGKRMARIDQNGMSWSKIV